MNIILAIYLWGMIPVFLGGCCVFAWMWGRNNWGGVYEMDELRFFMVIIFTGLWPVAWMLVLFWKVLKSFVASGKKARQEANNPKKTLR